MFRNVVSTVSALALLALCSCGESPVQVSELTLSATPDPVFAVASSGRSYTIEGVDEEPDEVVQYPWRASFTVMVTDTAGFGLDVTFVDLKVNQASGGIVTPPTTGGIERFEFELEAVGNRVEAFGSMTLNLNVWYDLPNDGREALVTVSVSYTDDGDFSSTQTVEARVQ